MKRLIVCCDGTANDPDQMDRDRIAPTNIVKFTRALEANNHQHVYYDQGVGTGWWAKKLVEGLSGAGISQNIKDAYRFLAKEYTPGDEIYCFGFSRGAFTVRSLCGMIHTFGLLTQTNSNDEKVREVYSAYQTTRPGVELDDYLKTCFQDVVYESKVKIKFLGVWDTVGSLGFPLLGNNTFEWNKHHNVSDFKETVEYAYHAVAIDEFRNQFKVSLLEPSNVSEELVQKWFAGSHSNIGGGYADAGLSDISLERIIEYLRGDTFNLEFNDEFIKNNININPAYFGELRNSRTGFYKIIPKNLRKYNGKKIEAEDLDESVVQRMLDDTTGYDPENVVDIKEEEESGKGTKKLKKEYHAKMSRETDKLDKKFWKKTEKVKQDKFSNYLAYSTAIGLFLWFIGSLIYISSDLAFGISLETWELILITLGRILLYVVLIPLGFLLALVILTVVGFTISSFFFKRSLKNRMKSKSKNYK